MAKFKVWIDGSADRGSVETDFGIIDAVDMNEALDRAAQSANYVDHADMAQELGWTESLMSIQAADPVEAAAAAGRKMAEYLNANPGEAQNWSELEENDDLPNEDYIELRRQFEEVTDRMERAYKAAFNEAFDK